MTGTDGSGEARRWLTVALIACGLMLLAFLIAQTGDDTAAAKTKPTKPKATPTPTPTPTATPTITPGVYDVPPKPRPFEYTLKTMGTHAHLDNNLRLTFPAIKADAIAPGTVLSAAFEGHADTDFTVSAAANGNDPLGSAKVTVKAHKTTTLRVTIAPWGRRALGEYRALIGTLTLTAQRGKTKTVSRRAFTLSPPAPPACFGAAARDPLHPCSNPDLRFSVVPKIAVAARAINSSCVAIQTKNPYICGFGENRSSSATTVALVGDSHASHWRAALEPAITAKRWRGLSFTRTGCPLTLADPILKGKLQKECTTWVQQMLHYFRGHPEIHTIFVSAHAGASVKVPAGMSAVDEKVRGFRKAWNALPKTVQHIVVIRDNPSTTRTTFACIKNAVKNHHQPGKACSHSRSMVLPVDPMARAAEGFGPRVQVIDMTRFFCDSKNCFPVIGGALVNKDTGHMTQLYSATLAPYLSAAVDRLAAGW